MEDFCIRAGALCAYGMGDLCIRTYKSVEGFRTYGRGFAVIPIPGNRTRTYGSRGTDMQIFARHVTRHDVSGFRHSIEAKLRQLVVHKVLGNVIFFYCLVQ
jgi:hypothetical protein